MSDLNPFIHYVSLDGIDEEKYDFVVEFLEDRGLDLNTLLYIIINRIYTTESIEFLFAKKHKRNVSDLNDVQADIDSKQDLHEKKNRITKKKAIKLFESKGVYVGHNVSFASKNKASDVYWSNPPIEVLDKDWYFILNDNVIQKLYLFIVPYGKLTQSDLVARYDKPTVFDIRIEYLDSSFKDMVSGFMFKEYLKNELTYEL